jgi:hypothetical protein
MLPSPRPLALGGLPAGKGPGPGRRGSLHAMRATPIGGDFASYASFRVPAAVSVA